MTLGALTACSQQFIPNSLNNSNTQQTSTNTQNAIAVPGVNAASNKGLPTPVVAPPSYNNRPLKAGESPQAERLPNGLPALKPLKGVNVDKLFAENISNTDRRFERVENAVVDMRREFEAVKPAIVRLVAVEEDIQQMVEQLEIMANQERSAPVAPVSSSQPQELRTNNYQTPPTSSVPQVLEPKPTPAPTPVTARTNGPTVTNFRTGQHSNKVRLVLDMSANTPYNVDLDSNENLLIIELPNAAWAGATSKTFSQKAPLIASYNVESIDGGKGTRIVIPLKKSSSILETKLLPPGSNPNFRMYVDLKL